MSKLLKVSFTKSQKSVLKQLLLAKTALYCLATSLLLKWSH